MTPRKYCFVATGYVVRDGKTLLVKHKKLGMWLPPAGTSTKASIPTRPSCARSSRRPASRPNSSPSRAPRHVRGRVESLHEPQRVQIEEIPGHNHHIDFIYYLRARPGEHVHRPEESDDIRWHTAEELGLPHVSDEIRESGRDAIRVVSAASPSENP
ncbi:MAG: hypothetical protein M0D55_02470 [Elusimicrobiota bacterium]|nr:MAG: hypothetical protein M0D55_02470 [Elusimicrobiota bacterium]